MMLSVRPNKAGRTRHLTVLISTQQCFLHTQTRSRLINPPCCWHTCTLTETQPLNLLFITTNDRFMNALKMTQTWTDSQNSFTMCRCHHEHLYGSLSRTSTSWLKSRASSPAPSSVCSTLCFTCSHWTSIDSRWYSSASRNVWTNGDGKQASSHIRACRLRQFNLWYRFGAAGLRSQCFCGKNTVHWDQAVLQMLNRGLSLTWSSLPQAPGTQTLPFVSGSKSQISWLKVKMTLKLKELK